MYIYILREREADVNQQSLALLHIAHEPRDPAAASGPTRVTDHDACLCIYIYIYR